MPEWPWWAWVVFAIGACAWIFVLILAITLPEPGKSREVKSVHIKDGNDWRKVWDRDWMPEEKDPHDPT